MEPTTFKEVNHKFGPPEGMEESQVRTIPAYLGQINNGNLDGAPVVTVAWKPSEEELKQLIGGNPIYLTCIGGLPPHYLTTQFPH